MVNGKKTFEKAMELIIILMAIDMKEIGILIFKVALEPIIIQTVIFTKVNGWMESQTVKATIYITEIKVYIRATGKMAKSKALDN